MERKSKLLFRLMGLVRLWVFLLLVALHHKVEAQLFKPLVARQSSIDFVNRFEPPDSAHINSFLYLWNGGGVAVGDVNGDDLQDLFFTGNTVGNRLYINQGNLQFRDATDQYGLLTTDTAWNTGVAMADVNNDGWPDLYVCRSQLLSRKGRNLLYINQNGKGFKEMAPEFGIDITDNCTQTVFFDADNDGDLDAYIITYPNQGAQYLLHDKGRDQGSDHFLINTDNFFKPREIDRKGLTDNGFGLGVMAAHFNNDGFTDLFVANDLISPDRLYLNPTLGLKDTMAAMFGHTSFNSMGCDVGDVNRDGHLDLLVLDMLPSDPQRRHKQTFLTSDYQELLERSGYHRQYVRNMLHLGDKKGEVACLYGIEATDWSWSPLLFDADNDGHLDLFVTTSLPKDFLDKDLGTFITDSITRLNKPGQKERIYRHVIEQLPKMTLPNRFFLGTDTAFVDKSEWLTLESVNTTGAAYADLDNDGDLDLVLNNFDTTAFILQNTLVERGSKNKWLRIKPLGTSANKLGYNTLINLKRGNTMIRYELTPIRGFQSTSEPFIHIGLGDYEGEVNLSMHWPALQKVSPITRFNQIIKVQQTELGPWFYGVDSEMDRPKETMKELEEREKVRIPLNFPAVAKGHTYNFKADFKENPLLHRAISRPTPTVAVADVNLDGHADVFFAYGDGGHMLLRDTDPTNASRTNPFLVSKPRPWCANDTAGWVSATLIFDINNDTLPDLMLGWGGRNENAPTFEVYLGIGSGNFKPLLDVPMVKGRVGAICAADFDADGDLDLFVGTRLSPRGYPQSPISHLLLNDGGRFVDLTAELAPALFHLGMVTAALWTDFDRDNDPDLFVVGEWMRPTLLINEGGRLELRPISTQLGPLNGWWNCIAGADLDNDGDTDYILGNFGQNSLIKASSICPSLLFYPNLNNDPRPDPVLTWCVGATRTLFPKRDKMIDHVTAMRKRFITYTAYAEASVSQVVGPNAPELRADELRSLVLLNKGKARFEAIPLPFEAQSAPVNHINATDLNNDNSIDLVLSMGEVAMNNEIGEVVTHGMLHMVGQGNGRFMVVQHTSTQKELQMTIPIGSNSAFLGWLQVPSSNQPKLVGDVAEGRFPTPKCTLENRLGNTANIPCFFNATKPGYLKFSDGTYRLVEPYLGQGGGVQQPTYILKQTDFEFQPQFNFKMKKNDANSNN